jgi:RHS repeat-associated protein
VAATYTFNPRNWLRCLTSVLGAVVVASFDCDGALAAPGQPWLAETRLSPTGQRRAMMETVGTATRTVAYGYDLLSRLTKEDIQAATASPTALVAYDGTGTGQGYDRVGNRRSRQVTGTLPGVSAYAGDTFNLRDLLNSGAGYTYDLNGNTTQEPGGTLYAYDAENRLVKVTKTDGTTITLAYDADGNRVKKVVDAPGTANDSTTLYLVDDRNPTGYAQVIEERDAAGATTVTYTYGLDLVSQRRGTKVSYYGYDGLGSVRYLTDETGTVTDTYTYDAFGILIGQQVLNGGVLEPVTPLNQHLSTLNSYCYTGEQWDGDLDLYYLRARYYQPQLGRFWTMDSYEGSRSDPQSLHKYLYVHGNPVNGVDPSGHEFTLLGLNVSQAISGGLQAMRVGGIAVAKRVAINSLYGSIIGGAAGQWDAILGGEDPWEGLQNGAMGGALFGGLGSFRAIQPVLQAIGIGLGTVGTIEAASDGHYAQAGFRGIMTAVGGFTAKYFRTIEGDSLQPRSLSNAQARQWYHDQLGKIPSQVDSAGSWQTKAMQAFTGRFMSLLRARELMSDQAAAGRLPPPKTLSQLVRKAYQKGLTGDAMWKSIYESSMRSNAGVDARFQYGDAAVPFYLWDVGGDE